MAVILVFYFQKVKMGSDLKRALLHVCDKVFLDDFLPRSVGVHSISTRLMPINGDAYAI